MLRRLPLPALSGLRFAALVMVATGLAGDGFFQFHDMRLLFDSIDASVYFREGEWALHRGQLPFRDTFSEYPLAANLLFGAVRFLSEQLPVFTEPFSRFSWLWMGLGAAGYGYAGTRLLKEGWLPPAAWLSPGVLYFSVLRFDIFPALACMVALWALRDERYLKGALWLGLCIALKGYAAAALPALGVFLMARVGFRRAVGLCAVAVAPMALSLAVVGLYAGLDGVLMPFEFHAGRDFNDETIYLAVNKLAGGGGTEFLARLREANVPLMLQIGFGLLAAALRPKTFEQLVHAFLVAIAGFVTASVFHSPQFVLWIVAVAVFARSRYTLAVAIALGWLSFLYFPIAFDLLRGSQPEPPQPVTALQSLSILAIVALQIAIMLRPHRQEAAKSKSNPLPAKPGALP